MKNLLVVVIVVICGSSCMLAVDTMHIGAYFSYGGASTAESVITFEGCNCPGYEDISGTMLASGVSVLIPVSSGDGLHVGILSQLGYGSVALSQTMMGDSLPSLDPEGAVVYSVTEHQLHIEQQGVLLDVAADLTWSGLTLDIGVSSLLNSTVKGRKTLELVEPKDAVFDPFLNPPGTGVLEDGDTYVFDEWDDEQVAVVSYGIYGALGYTHDFGSIVTTLAAESRMLWAAAIPDATAPLWAYGGVFRIMLEL